MTEMEALGATRTIDVTEAARAAGLNERAWPGRIALSLGALAICDHEDGERSARLSGALGARLVADQAVARRAIGKGATLCTIPTTGQRFVVREMRDGAAVVLVVLSFPEWALAGQGIEIVDGDGAPEALQ